MNPKENVVEDARFSKIFRDSKFKNLPKRKGKVKIDKRFQSMFTDDAFQVKYTVDKRGRRISKSTTEDLSKFYHLSSDDENDDIDTTLIEGEKLRDKNVSKKLKDMNVDYARGEGKLFSDSSSDESESEESESEIYHEWNELDRDADTTDNPTKRLAVCNMDWDKVKALDLMALFKSFVPAQGTIHSVAIYPSEFGLQRLAEEEVKGPAELVNPEKNATVDSDSDDEGEEGKQYRMELMREYQLNRLKYYYAVATFDSSETANVIYDSCNGFEYGKSGILLDLRFIDDDMTFDHEPKDVCDSEINLQKYKPLDFANSALLQTKVELTWDETDPRRRELTQRLTEAAKRGDVNDSDLEDLVALSGSDEEDEEEDILEALKKNSTPEEFAPFQDLLEKNKSSKAAKRARREEEMFKSDDEHEIENAHPKKSKKSKKSGEVTDTNNEMDEKQKSELELLLLDEDGDSKYHFALDQSNNKSKKNRKKGKFKKNTDELPEDDFQVNVNDQRFSALYSSHLFNIDPTDPNYKKTKGMQLFVEEKRRRLSKETNPSVQSEISKRPKNAELSLLMKSVKSKTKSLFERSMKNKSNKRS